MTGAADTAADRRPQSPASSNKASCLFEVALNKAARAFLFFRSPAASDAQVCLFG